MKLQTISDMESGSEYYPAVTTQATEVVESMTIEDSVPNQSKIVPVLDTIDSKEGASQLAVPSQSSGVLSSKVTSRFNQVLRNEQHFDKQALSLVLNTLDFAGQQQYRSMHHCFIMRRALYVVVFRIPDMLDYLDKKSKYNPLNDFRYWIRSIHAHISSVQEDDDKQKPFQRVLSVGTHRGDSTKTRLKDINNHIYENLILTDDKKYINHIFSMPEKKAEINHFVPVENSIDHKTDSYLQDSGIADVQDRLKIMSESLSFLQNFYPIKWLNFSEQLKRLKYQKLVPIGNMKELKKIAVKCGIVEEDEQKLVLKFFHFTGRINYLEILPKLFLECTHSSQQGGRPPVSISHLVVLSPQWLMKIMREVVELDPKGSIPGHDRDQVRDLEKHGVASIKLLNSCWCNIGSPDVNSQHLSLICQAFCLIFPDQSGSKYVIPCKLPDKFSEGKLCSRMSNSRNAILFYFDFCKFLPDVIYHRLICLMVSKCSRYELSQFKCFFDGELGTRWIIEKEEAKQRFKIIVIMTKEQPKPHYYINHIHNYLFKICKESFLELDYFGGPEVNCDDCKGEPEVIKCVAYSSGDSIASKWEEERSLQCNFCFNGLDMKCFRVPKADSGTEEKNCDEQTLPKTQGGNVDTTPLNEDNNFHEIIQLLQDYEARCYKIGTWLKLTQKKLEAIRAESPDHATGMEKVISNWLRGNYDTKMFGPLTWKMLVDAVDARTGGNNAALAQKIARAHPQISDTQAEVSITGFQDRAGTSRETANTVHHEVHEVPPKVETESKLSNTGAISIHEYARTSRETGNTVHHEMHEVPPKAETKSKKLSSTGAISNPQEPSCKSPQASERPSPSVDEALANRTLKLRLILSVVVLICAVLVYIIVF